MTDKIGYAINPGGHPQLASGFISGVSPDSKNKDAAYLYIQWMHSKDQSLKNVMRPVGLRDPFRLSHYDSPEYQALWPTAPDYLEVLKDGAAQGLCRHLAHRDLQVPGRHVARGDLRHRRRGSARRRSTRWRPNGIRSPSRSASTSSARPTRSGQRSRRPIVSECGDAISRDRPAREGRPKAGPGFFRRAGRVRPDPDRPLPVRLVAASSASRTSPAPTAPAASSASPTT